MKPSVRVVGVEASLVPSMKRAIEQGAPVKVPAARTIAEGIAVREVGLRNMTLVKDLVDDIVLVDDDEIARAIVFLLERDKTVAEGAGAAAVAALLSKRFDARGKHVCAFVSGGNIDVNVLSRIIERGLVESGRLGRLEVLAPDRPGALAEMLSVVAQERANVVEVHHERAFGRGGLGQVLIEIVVETRGHENVNAIMAGLRERGFDVSPRA
jgi:threonine dehydratase